MDTNLELNDEYDSYNTHLYNKRLELKLSRKNFAKKLHINPFYYRLMEKGYFKPTIKMIDKISDFLNEDFSVYLDGIKSYPHQLPRKIEPKRDRLVLKRKTRITWITLTIIFFLTFLSTLISSVVLSVNTKSLLPSNYQIIIDGIRESKEQTNSLTGSFTRPEIFKKSDDGSYISLIGDYSSQEPFYLDMNYTEYKTDYRTTAILKMRSQDNYLKIYLTYVNYTTYDMYTREYEYYSKTNYTAGVIVNSMLEEVNDSSLNEKFNNHLNLFEDKICDFIYETFGITYSFEKDLINDLLPIKTNIERTKAALSSVYLVFIVLFGISAMITVYSFIYGKRKYGAFVISPSDYERKVLLLHTESNNVPNDFQFGPIIPEIIYQIFGVILTSLASIFVFVEIGLHIAGKENIISGSGLNSLITLLVSGTIFLFFIDFDSFLGDRKAIRYSLLYAILFFVVLNVQIVIINAINQVSIGKLFLSQYQIVLPNYFGSIAMYFLLTVFLFAYPKICNTKRKLIIFRLCSLFPIAFLITAHLLESLNNIYHFDFNTTWQYVLTGHRPQITILIILYLVGLFFIRFFIKKKYGTKASEVLFNGNRYLVIKNLLAFGITCLISFFEGLLFNITLAHSFGLGLYPRFIILGALLLFYRPHLGIRKARADRLTFITHTITFAIVYVLIAIILALYYFVLAL